MCLTPSIGHPRHRVTRVISIAVLIGAFSLVRLSVAGEIDTIPTPPASNEVSPGLNLQSPEPLSPSPKKPLVHRWWFWTTLGAVAATAIVIVAVTQRDSTPPASLLGNQEFQP